LAPCRKCAAALAARDAPSKEKERLKTHRAAAGRHESHRPLLLADAV
jgi:hypothetical protein